MSFAELSRQKSINAKLGQYRNLDRSPPCREIACREAAGWTEFVHHIRAFDGVKTRANEMILLAVRKFFQECLATETNDPLSLIGRLDPLDPTNHRFSDRFFH